MNRSFAMKCMGMLATCLAVLAFTSVNCQTAKAVVLADWTFETGTTGNPPGGVSGVVGTDISGISPATGSGDASGHHASSSTTYNNPAGNGSVESFSSNNWAVDDYYQFTTSTTGYQQIMISWDQTSSNTGPKDFKVQYSTNGASFFDIVVSPTYTVLPNA